MKNTEYLGAETVLALLMVKKCQSVISIFDLNRTMVSLKKRALEEGFNICFFTSKADISSDLYWNKDFYSPIVDSTANIVSIALEKNKTFDDLEKEFIRPLPQEVKLFLRG